MMENLIFAFWFFLPAGIANMSPVIANWIPVIKDWNTPLDFGFSWNSKRILGDNKRLRGLIFGTVIGALIAFLQHLLMPNFYTDSHVASTSSIGFSVLVGALLGLGALFGDAVESFFKRRAGVAPGDSWFPFDQLDYTIGGLLAVSLFTELSPAQGASVVFIYFGLHIFVTYVFYLLGVRDKPI